MAAAHELQQRQSDHPLELWQEKRKVVRLDALPEAAALTRRPGNSRGKIANPA